MDILSQYKQQHPEALCEELQWRASHERGFLIRLVMRLSGGRIRETKQAMERSNFTHSFPMRIIG